MLIYILLFITVALPAFLISPQNQEKRKNIITFYAVVVCATLTCGLRDMLGGYDSYIYGDIFDSTAEQLRNGLDYSLTTAWIENKNEEGYGLYNILIGYITRNRYIYFLITAIIYYIALTRHIIKYCRFPYLCFFFFFCLYYFFTFTYLRQILATIIVWFSIPYAIRRKPIHFFIIVTLAAIFHNSAVLFSFFYFISNKQFSQTQLYKIYALSLLIGFTSIGTFLMNTIGVAINEQKAELSANAAEQQGVRIDYIIEAVFFIYLIHRSYYRLPNDKVSLAMKNIFLSFIFVLLFFVRFSDGGRLSWYFVIGPAWACSELWQIYRHAIKFRMLIFGILSILYFRIINAWGVLLTPYQTFFHNENRKGDYIWEKYEYDHRYDDNKLYKL